MYLTCLEIAPLRLPCANCPMYVLNVILPSREARGQDDTGYAIGRRAGNSGEGTAYQQR